MNIPQTIILADGDFPSSPLAGKWLRECRYVVCCDGAANAYLHFGKRPAAIVGDGDSLLPEIKERYAHLIHREAEQDTNDLSKAFRFCLSQGRRDITIMGATGKREDHTLGNISLLADYMNQAEVRMLTDYGIVFSSLFRLSRSLFLIWGLRNFQQTAWFILFLFLRTGGKGH